MKYLSISVHVIQNYISLHYLLNYIFLHYFLNRHDDMLHNSQCITKYLVILQNIFDSIFVRIHKLHNNYKYV